jgi:DNA-binding NtrC family response regulator
MPTILVAENDTGLRKMLAHFLREAGYDVIAAATGDDAIWAAERHNGPIDLLITDIVMPGTGGADLYAWMKTMQDEIRVLFISGFMSREPVPGAFLKKPFSAETLLEKVQELLEKPAAGGSGG